MSRLTRKIREWYQYIGRKGGKSLAKKLGKEGCIERARHAASVRFGLLPPPDIEESGLTQQEASKTQR